MPINDMDKLKIIITTEMRKLRVKYRSYFDDRLFELMSENIGRRLALEWVLSKIEELRE